MIAPDRTSSSPFFNNFKPTGLGVIIHATRSGVSMNPNELEGTLNWFKNPIAKVSSHWVIGRAGEKVRVIPDHQQAWHAGQHNGTHWGIEVCQGVSADGYTQIQMEALYAVCRGYRDDFGIQVVHSFLGFPGHEETPQGKSIGKTDPGVNFNWNEFIAKVSSTSNRIWHYGDENSGLEFRGNQQVTWNKWVETDALGDVAGNFPGEHWHNQAGTWIKVLP